MKKQSILSGFLVAGLMVAPSLVMAEGGKGDASMERSKAMTQERMMKHDQTGAHDALMERDQKRMQLQDGSGDQLKDQTRDQKRLQDGTGIYGSAMMNEDEVKQYRERLRTANSEEERMQLMKQHRTEMQERARQQGIELSDEE